MKSKITGARCLRTIVVAALVLLSVPVQADEWTDGGFESDLGWTGTDSFLGLSATEGADPNSATYYTLIHDQLLTESGTWVEDSTETHTYAGKRMFWLRNYADPDTICVGHRYQTTDSLTAGQMYQLSYKFAAFNPDNPNGSTLTTKPVAEVTSWDPNAGSSGAFVTQEQSMSFSDGSISVPEDGNFSEFELQAWNDSSGNSAIEWHTATTTFFAPEANGQSVYIWASMTNDSNGMLIDGISLIAIPEPSAVAVLTMLGGLLTIRRRRI